MGVLVYEKELRIWSCAVTAAPSCELEAFNCQLRTPQPDGDRWAQLHSHFTTGTHEKDADIV